MARGWVSKAVEAQIEAAVPTKSARGRKPPSAGWLELIRKREGLDLSRTRVLRDLARATHPRHQTMLKSALAHLDVQLSEIARLLGKA